MHSVLTQNSSRTSRWLSLIEIVSVVGLIEVYLWFLKGTTYKFSKNLVVVSIVGLVGVSIWNHRHELPAKVSWSRAWAKVLLGSVGLAIFLLLGAWAIGVIDVDSYSSFWAKFVSDGTWWKRKSGTVVVQQIALQLCLLPACVSLCRNQWGGVVMASVLFGLIHSPNPYLMLITASAGLFWCSTWLGTRRMIPLICSHLMLAILAREYCNDALYNMRVGAKVLDLFPETIQSASGKQFINDPMLLSGAWSASNIEGDVVTCRGWAVDVRNRELVDEIVVYSGIDQAIDRFPVVRAQNDYVRKAYGDKVAKAGFEIDLPLRYFRRYVRLYAFREGVGYSYLTYSPDDSDHRAGNPYAIARKQEKEKRLASERGTTIR